MYHDCHGRGTCRCRSPRCETCCSLRGRLARTLKIGGVAISLLAARSLPALYTYRRGRCRPHHEDDLEGSSGIQITAMLLSSMTIGRRRHNPRSTAKVAECRRAVRLGRMICSRGPESSGECGTPSTKWSKCVDDQGMTSTFNANRKHPSEGVKSLSIVIFVGIGPMDNPSP